MEQTLTYYTKKRELDMLPVWFFIVLIVLIGYMLFITRPNEDSFMMISKNHIRKLQFWINRSDKS